MSSASMTLTVAATVTLVADIGVISSQVWLPICWDTVGSKMYAYTRAEFSGGASLKTMNTTTGVLTDIGNPDGFTVPASLAMHPSGIILGTEDALLAVLDTSTGAIENSSQWAWTVGTNDIYSVWYDTASDTIYHSSNIAGIFTSYTMPANTIDGGSVYPTKGTIPEVSPPTSSAFGGDPVGQMTKYGDVWLVPLRGGGFAKIAGTIAILSKNFVEIGRVTVSGITDQIFGITYDGTNLWVTTEALASHNSIKLYKLTISNVNIPASSATYGIQSVNIATTAATNYANQIVRDTVTGRYYGGGTSWVLL